MPVFLWARTLPNLQSFIPLYSISYVVPKMRHVVQGVFCKKL